MTRIPLFLLLLTAPLAAQSYVPLHLDDDGGPDGGLALSIARTGDVACGRVFPPGQWDQPARWLGTGTALLPLLPGDSAGTAWDVNDAGTAVGESVEVVPQGQLTFFFFRGVVWAGGGPVALADLAVSGDTDIEPFTGLAINDHGQIVGQGKREGVVGLRGFLLEDGVMTDLGSLQGTLTGSTEPADMNEQGVVVGSSEAPDHFDHAFVWQDGTMTDLHALGGVPGRNSHARAVNEAGLIVGSADPTADFLDWEHAAVWQDGVLEFLPELGGGTGGVFESFARDVNDHGTIVGTSINTSSQARAVIWRDGQLSDLNDLIPPGTGWTLANAYAISNDGRIVGEGFSPLGLKPFLLVPDCDGGFDVHASGCAGSGGFVPGLWGEGCPVGGGSLSLSLTNGLGAAPGLLLVGLGDGMAPFKGCTLDVLPLSPLSLPLALTPGGPGAGGTLLGTSLPPVVPAGTLHLQALIADPGAPAGVAVTNALRIDFSP